MLEAYFHTTFARSFKINSTAIVFDMKTPCFFCKNCVVKPDLKLFEDSDLSHPEVLKAHNEFENQKKARRNLESDNVRNLFFLNYEPEFHPWCKGMTPFSTAEHGDILNKLKNNQILPEEAKEKLIEITGRMVVLQSRAMNGEHQAAYELFEKGAMEIGNQFSTGSLEFHYAIAAQVNLNNLSEAIGCPLFELKK